MTITNSSAAASAASSSRPTSCCRASARSARKRSCAWRCVVVVLLLGWAALAHVDEVTRGDGRVIPSRQLQVVQSLDGGVVTEILVKEGQVVEAGQLLLKLEETRATSGVRESAAQGFALRARQARLRAIAEGAAFQPPAVGNDAEERRIVDGERRLYESRHVRAADDAVDQPAAAAAAPAGAERDALAQGRAPSAHSNSASRS